MQNDVICLVNLGYDKVEFLLFQPNFELRLISKVLHYSSAFVQSDLLHRNAAAFQNPHTMQVMLVEIAKLEKLYNILIVQIVLCCKTQLWKYYNASSELTFPEVVTIELEKIDSVIASAIDSIDIDGNVDILTDVFVQQLRTKEMLIYEPHNLKADYLSVLLGLDILPLSFVETVNRFLDSASLNVAHYLNSATNIYHALVRLENRSTAMVSLFIDIGTTITNYCLVQNGIMQCCDCISLGGFDLTNDLANIFKINLSQAEEVKLLYSKLFYKDDNYVMEIPSSSIRDDTKKQFLIADVKEVLNARINEIFSIIQNKLPADKAIKTIYITGGTCNLANVTTECNSVFEEAQCIVVTADILNNLWKGFINDGDISIINNASCTLLGGAMRCIYNHNMWENMKYGTFYHKKSKLMKLVYSLLH